MNIKDLIENIDNWYRTLKELREVLIEKKYSKVLKSHRINIQQQIINNTFLSKDLVIYFTNVNENGEPYIIGIDEPRQMRQIKKLVNALYHAEQAVILLEKYYIVSIYHIYEAMSLATHLDVNVSVILKNQLNVLTPFLIELQKIIPESINISNYHLIDSIKLPNSSTLPLKTGEFLGSFIDIMKPAEIFDYQVLTQFGSKLPEYIKLAKETIANIGSKALEIDASLEQKDIEKLQKEATTLIDSIATVQVNSLFNIKNIYHYISIIKRIITISNEIIYQFKSLNTTSHQRVKEWLYQFKYFYIPKILMLADSLEEALLLRAGFISEPLIIELTSYYEQAVQKLSFVNFENNILGAQVKSLIDYKFSKIRLNGLQKTIDQIKIKKYLIQESEIAKQKFYELLIESNSNHLGEMSVEIKRQLKIYYILFQQYMVELAPEFDEQLVKLLNQKPRCNNAGFIPWQLIKLKNATTQATGLFDVYSKCISYEDKLTEIINKDTNTFDFRLLLNDKIYKNISNQTNKYIKTEICKISYHILVAYKKLEPSFIVVSALTNKQSGLDFLQLYLDVINKSNEFTSAYNNYIDFIECLKKYSGSDINLFTLKEKQHLRSIYIKMQPFLVNCLEKEGLKIDIQLIAALNPPFKTVDKLGRVLSDLSFDKLMFIFKTKKQFSSAVIKYRDGLYKQLASYYKEKFRHKYFNISTQKQLAVGCDPIRRSYLIKRKTALKIHIYKNAAFSS